MFESSRKITGSLDTQIEDAMHFFRRNRLVGARKNPDRLEIHAFSERAIFEAIGLRGIIRFQENMTWKREEKEFRLFSTKV
ncbi:MAG: hypothetical protein KA146_10390 [Leptospiraceae bacterium]|nr:hypothetical protein [Leptospiraceae bacterium]